MPTSSKRRWNEQLYLTGHALFQQCRYQEALVLFQQAEDAFRAGDARGYPVPHSLSNGVSGLANTLVASGFCHQKLGNFKTALTCFESSFINSKYENKKAFRAFTKTFRDALIACYEEVLKNHGDEARGRVPDSDLEIDSSFQFPWSLPPDVIPHARLHELDPERYASYRDFYHRAEEKDSSRRMADEDSVMKRTSVYVWSILCIIGAAYGLIVTEALLHMK
jgi:tetratricopeptide (TPR) repeat protein